MSGKVVKCSRNSFDIYIGRAFGTYPASKWGNPFKIGVDGSRAEVLQQYEDYLKNKPELMAALPELQGKILGCWCAPLPCHGDILVRLSEEKPL